uniref:Predicted protein n=1 Tax=Hordeum vulgare subsp. vulgare TaxID=112509 RepID=F2DXL4_HORVV|nr:predicted protein [Hordeum vulgare subsp. vulgare]
MARSAPLCFRQRRKPREAEIGHLGYKLGVQQNVAGLDVAMEYRRVRFCVQIQDAP